MNSPVRFDIGAKVTCRDDAVAGHVKRVVADPLAGCLTHLVVGPALSQEHDRLVPIGMAQVESSAVVLSCDAEEFEKLRPAVETEFIADGLGESGYGPEDTYLWPNYGLSAAGVSAPGTSAPGFRVYEQSFHGGAAHTVLSDQVPDGEVEFRRGSAVIATDGPVGHLHGLIIDPGTSQITHLLLEHGHLWGHREVAIPLSLVTTMTGDIKLSVPKSEIEGLPAVAHEEQVPR